MKTSHIDGGFPCNEHLRKKSDFDFLFKNGKRASILGGRLFYAQNALGHNRIGFTFPHGYGNAIQRNRSKRVSREAYRAIRPFLKSGFDIVFLAYPPKKDGGVAPKVYSSDNLASRTRQLRALFERAGLLCSHGY